MKRNLLLLMFIFTIKVNFAQTVINYSINFGINQSFLSDLNGIKDYTGFSVKDISLGYLFGGSAEYEINKRLGLVFGANLLSIEKQAFRYYGVLYVRAAGKPQLFFKTKFFFSKKHYFSVGTIASFEVFDSHNLTYYEQDELRPERTFEELSQSIVNPILSIGFGNRKVLENGRVLEFVLFYNIGFRRVNFYTFERLTPPKIVSTFAYKGDCLNFSIKWFFKKKH